MHVDSVPGSVSNREHGLATVARPGHKSPPCLVFLTSRCLPSLATPNTSAQVLGTYHSWSDNLARVFQCRHMLLSSILVVPNNG